MEGVYKISKQVQQQAKAYRKALYAESPGVERFAKARRLLLGALALMLLAHICLDLLLLAQGVLAPSELPQELFKCFLHLVLLWLAALGNWKSSLGLYLIAAPSILSLWQTCQLVTPAALLASSPWLFGLFSIDAVYTILLLAAALWLTLAPKSRRLSYEARAIALEYTRFINDHLTEGASETKNK